MCGLLYTKVLVPGRGVGVLLQLKVPFNCAYAKSLGFSLYGWSNSNIISACYNSRYQSCMVKYGYVEHIPVMK